MNNICFFVFNCSAEYVQEPEAPELGNLAEKLPSDDVLSFQQIKAMAKECNQQPTSSTKSADSQALGINFGLVEIFFFLQIFRKPFLSM